MDACAQSSVMKPSSLVGPSSGDGSAVPDNGGVLAFENFDSKVQ